MNGGLAALLPPRRRGTASPRRLAAPARQLSRTVGARTRMAARRSLPADEGERGEARPKTALQRSRSGDREADAAGAHVSRASRWGPSDAAGRIWPGGVVRVGAVRGYWRVGWHNGRWVGIILSGRPGYCLECQPSVICQRSPVCMAAT